MKTALKGRRYHPGCLYSALLCLVSIGVIIFIDRKMILWKHEIAFLIVSMLIAAADFFTGWLFFKLTEKLILKLPGLYKEKAHTIAEILEFIVFFAVMLGMFFLLRPV